MRQLAVLSQATLFDTFRKRSAEAKTPNLNEKFAFPRDLKAYGADKYTNHDSKTNGAKSD